MDLCYDAQRFAFLLGYLIGWRSMGASHDELLSKTQGFTVDDLGSTRWHAESEQKNIINARTGGLR